LKQKNNEFESILGKAVMSYPWFWPFLGDFAYEINEFEQK